MRARVLAAVAGFVAAIPATPSLAAAAPVSVAIDAYPTSAPSPLGDSRVPSFLDDDETVRVRLAPDGSPLGVTDDLLLKLRGVGDYALTLPGPVADVGDLGGDSPPGLQDGHVRFLGYVSGQGQLGAAARLDLATAAAALPLALRITYTAAGGELKPADLARAAGPVTVRLEVDDLTARPHPFLRGQADPRALAQVLEDLRRAPAAWSPEVDLGALLPLPATLPLAPPTAAVQGETYVPFALTLQVRLPAGAEVRDPGGAEIGGEGGGTRLAWRAALPSGPAAGGSQAFAFTFAAAHPRVPAVELRADPAPLPAALFTPPDGGTWAAWLARARDRSAPALLAEEGAASLHRIGDLTPPVGRPGSGPVRLSWDLVLDSGSAPPARAAVAVAPRGQAWAQALAALLLGLLLLNAAWVWVRH